MVLNSLTPVAQEGSGSIGDFEWEENEWMYQNTSKMFRNPLQDISPCFWKSESFRCLIGQNPNKTSANYQNNKTLKSFLIAINLQKKNTDSNFLRIITSKFFLLHCCKDVLNYSNYILTTDIHYISTKEMENKTNNWINNKDLFSIFCVLCLFTFVMVRNENWLK